MTAFISSKSISDVRPTTEKSGWWIKPPQDLYLSQTLLPLYTLMGNSFCCQEAKERLKSVGSRGNNRVTTHIPQPQSALM